MVRSSDDSALVQLLLESLRNRFDNPSSTKPDLISLVVVHFSEHDLWELGSVLVNDSDEDTAILGTLLLRELKTYREAVSSLLAQQWTSDRSMPLQYWMVCAFGILPSNRVLANVLQFVDDHFASMRDAVATALGNVAGAELPPQAEAALIRLSKDRNDEVRFSAVFEIARWWMRTREVRLRIALERAVSDTDRRVVRIATDALKDL